MNQILLTTPQRVKTMTVLGGTVDDELLQPVILTAQERYLHPVLGGDLFKKLQQLIEDDEVDDNPTYKTLLDEWITPCLVQYSFAEAVPLLRLRFANNSVVIMDSEQSTSADRADIKPVIDSALHIANWYKERMIDYLCTSGIAEYKTATDPNIGASSQNYTGGLNIGYNEDNEATKILKQIYHVK